MREARGALQHIMSLARSDDSICGVVTACNSYFNFGVRKVLFEIVIFVKVWRSHRNEPSTTGATGITTRAKSKVSSLCSAAVREGEGGAS